MSSILNPQGAAAAMASSATHVGGSTPVTLTYTPYRSSLNHCDFFGRTITIVSTTAGGALIGSGVGLVTAGPPGAVFGGAIGGGIGFGVGCLVVSWDIYQFRKWKLKEQARDPSIEITKVAGGGAGVSVSSCGESSSSLAPTRQSLDQKVAALFGERGGDFLCPLTGELIVDPVILRVDDMSTRVFEKMALEHWIQANKTCPLSGRAVTMKNVFPDLKTLAIMNKVASLITKNSALFPQFTPSDIDGLACYAMDCEKKMNLFESIETSRLEKELHEGRMTEEAYFSSIANLAETLNPEVSL